MEKILKKLNQGKKRQINLENWKDERRKMLRNSGKEYISRNGKVVPGKKYLKPVSLY